MTNLLEELNDQHSELLALLDENAALLTPAKEFIEKLANAGTDIADARQRSHLRGMIRFWSSHIYDQTGEFLEIQLLPSIKREQKIMNVGQEDWGNALLTSNFINRQEELSTLKHWILMERCHLILVNGMGGIGKSALASELLKQIKDEFAFVIWRDLRNGPPIEAILTDCIRFLSNQQWTGATSENVKDLISELVTELQNNRCLIILDNIETIMQTGQQSGLYKNDYEGYRDFIMRIAETSHQSCLLLTSREKSREIPLLEFAGSLVKSLELKGLEYSAGKELLETAGLSGTDEDIKALIALYAGNPLALKLVASTIRDVFLGNITEYLSHGFTVFSILQDLLEYQFARLSKIETDIVYWIAIEREPIHLNILHENIRPSTLKKALVEALQSLLRRSLIEKLEDVEVAFGLQPVVMEYLTNHFITKISEEICEEDIGLLNSHAIIKANSKDYIRQSQIRLILNSITENLLSTMSKDEVEKKLIRLLDISREHLTNYLAGNVINLLTQIGYDLRGYDFSNLRIWHAYLQETLLYNVNFSNSDLSYSVFFGRFC